MGAMSMVRSPTLSQLIPMRATCPAATSSMRWDRYGAREMSKPSLHAAIHGSLAIWQTSLVLGSIAFPAISTGIFGFPKSLAAQMILSTILDYLTHNPASSLKLIRLVLFDQETLQAFIKAWEQDDHFRS